MIVLVQIGNDYFKMEFNNRVQFDEYIDHEFIHCRSNLEFVVQILNDEGLYGS